LSFAQGNGGILRFRGATGKVRDKPAVTFVGIQGQADWGTQELVFSRGKGNGGFIAKSKVSDVQVRVNTLREENRGREKEQ